MPAFVNNDTFCLQKQHKKNTREYVYFTHNGFLVTYTGEKIYFIMKFKIQHLQGNYQSQWKIGGKQTWILSKIFPITATYKQARNYKYV